MKVKINKVIVNATGMNKPIVSSNMVGAQVFILDYNEIKKNEAIYSMCTCGTCGSNKSDNDDGLCENGHDNWVEIRDFFDENLKGHIDEACSNLSLNRDELITHIIWG